MTGGEVAGHAPKVSVVVPVYNPGPHLRRCTDSLLDQSLPADEYEVIFVDDGSTDESPARLDALAARHPNVRVIHQPNSGWPGQPRNVGIDAARGEYIYFVDHDDALGREALERLYATATRNGSDIVIGKMAGHGRGAPHHVFLENRDRATLTDSPIISALSPHKLFRRAFLDEHGLRYPEGRRRLEDQVFVVKAYFAADVISILADYTCYYHFALADRSNAATGRYDPTGGFDPAYYYRFLREVLEVVETNTEPGPVRDRLLRRFAENELLGRLGGPRFLRSGPDRQQAVLTEVRAVVDAHVPPSVDAILSPLARTRMALVRADGRLDEIVQLARAEREVTAAARVLTLEPRNGRRLGLVARVSLVNRTGPLTFERGADRPLLPVPAAVAAVVPDEARSLPQPLRGDIRIVARRSDDSTELVLRSSVTQRMLEAPPGVRVEQTIEAEIDPQMLREGSSPRPGRWKVLVRVAGPGFSRETWLRRAAGSGLPGRLTLLDGREDQTVVGWTGREDRLALDVGPPVRRRAHDTLRRWLRRQPAHIRKIKRRMIGRRRPPR